MAFTLNRIVPIALRVGVALFLCGALCRSTVAAAEKPHARHSPAKPRSGDAVRIDVDASALGADTAPVLEYEVVAPGRYVARDDPAFKTDWKSMPLSRADATRWSAELPAAIHKNRVLVRYRVRSGANREVVVPPKEDAQGNLAYFVYDGVPAWRGAVDPKGDSQARTPTEFPADVLSRIPVYQLVASAKSVETAMWRPEFSGKSNDPRHEYGATGTIVYDGVVYDHVGYRARGGGWRHAMGKNMWKFNFNSGHRLAAKDDYGRPYAAKWDKLNLGACIQQGDYGMRGEQGLFEATTYRLFNLAGVPAPRTHWIHLRVVTDPEETPADQYRGDFWGLYLATENVDGGFLREHDLDEGNLYKIENFQPTVHHRDDGSKDDVTDGRMFMGQLMRGNQRRVPGLKSGPGWWDENLDLASYYGYRSILEAVHHYDIDSGKNYFIYHDLKTGRWQYVPWDVDLTWGEHMYGGGYEPIFRAGLIAGEPYATAYKERLTELRDLLLNPEAIGRVIDEHAAVIWDGRGRPSLADADRAKWDHHPIMSSSRVMHGKSDPGLFYFGDPRKHIDSMVATMKQFALQRQSHLDRLTAGYRPPAAPKAPTIPSAKAADKKVTATAAPADGKAPGKLRWRLAEVSDPKAAGFDPKKPWHHEIEAIWESETSGKASVEVPADRFQSGHSYRLRVRSLAEDGRWSRWSEPAALAAP